MTYKADKEDVETVLLDLVPFLLNHEVKNLACKDGQNDVRDARTNYEQHSESQAELVISHIPSDLGKRLFFFFFFKTKFLFFV